MLLTNTDIDNCCKSIVGHSKRYDMYSYIVFDSLYKTGLRINELLDYSRISIVDINSVLVQTQKFSNPRIIPIEDFNPVFISHLASSSLHSLIRSYSYYSEKMLLYNNLFNKLYINKKRISTHLFRHNFVKKLYTEGSTIQQISNTIGERDDKNTLGYVYSQILSEK
ncbi:MAG: tyrosine-type recombinase/integrase [Bacteroidales bacterium]|nr:tyrosine-type recombinase/integrase [Bacteroidales bacterium]